MTPNDIFDGARNQTNITDSSYITNSMMRRWLNDALKIASHEAGGVEYKDTSVTSISGTADYTIPNGMFEIKWAQFDGKPLDWVNFEEKELVSIYTTTSPQGVPRWYLYWGTTLTLVPTPSTAKTITIYGFRTHPDLTSSDDASSTAILLPDTFHSALVDYVAFRMTLKEGTGRHQPFYDLWNAGLVDIKKNMRERKHQQRSPLVRDVYKTVRTQV